MGPAAKPTYLNLMLTSFPTMIIISVFLAITSKWYFIFVPAVFVGILLFTKPIDACETCGLPFKKEVKGFFEFHTQCECVPDRWRPVWYSWIEDWRNKILSKIRKGGGKNGGNS